MIACSVQDFFGFELSPYEEAIASKMSKHWLAAMQDEMTSLKMNWAWTLVEKPQQIETYRL